MNLKKKGWGADECASTISELWRNGAPTHMWHRAGGECGHQPSHDANTEMNPSWICLRIPRGWALDRSHWTPTSQARLDNQGIGLIHLPTKGLNSSYVKSRKIISLNSRQESISPSKNNRRKTCLGCQRSTHHIGHSPLSDWLVIDSTTSREKTYH